MSSWVIAGDRGHAQSNPSDIGEQMISERRVGVVSGAAQGIGQAYAVRLAHEGYNVALADIQPCEDTEPLVRDAGGEVRAWHCDVRSEDDVAALAEGVRSTFGRGDVLVDNAGIYPYDEFAEMTFKAWRDVVGTSLDGSFLMSKAFAPMMQERQWGRIVNVSSCECWLVLPKQAHYISAKMAIVGLTRALATELADDNITVNAIAPGITDTPTVRRDAPEYLDKLPPLQAIHRHAVPEDMANLMAFLISDNAKFFTAQVMAHDGGWVRL